MLIMFTGDNGKREWKERIFSGTSNPKTSPLDCLRRILSSTCSISESPDPLNCENDERREWETRAFQRVPSRRNRVHRNTSVGYRDGGKEEEESLRYATRACHEGKEQRRKDDLEQWAYMIAEVRDTVLSLSLQESYPFSSSTKRASNGEIWRIRRRFIGWRSNSSQIDVSLSLSVSHSILSFQLFRKEW